jgi:hypothetical protein
MTPEQVQAHSGAQSESSPSQDTDPIQTEIRLLIPTLESRGTGQYRCLYGGACAKGGVKDGALQTFLRNSDFKYVLLSW